MPNCHTPYYRATNFKHLNCICLMLKQMLACIGWCHNTAMSCLMTLPNRLLFSPFKKKLGSKGLASTSLVVDCQSTTVCQCQFKHSKGLLALYDADVLIYDAKEHYDFFFYHASVDFNPFPMGHMYRHHNIRLGLQGTAVRTATRQSKWRGKFHCK